MERDKRKPDDDKTRKEKKTQWHELQEKPTIDEPKEMRSKSKIFYIASLHTLASTLSHTHDNMDGIRACLHVISMQVHMYKARAVWWLPDISFFFMLAQSFVDIGKLAFLHFGNLNNSGKLRTLTCFCFCFFVRFHVYKLAQPEMIFSRVLRDSMTLYVGR